MTTAEAAKTVQAVAEQLAGQFGMGWADIHADHNGAPMDTTDYDGRAVAFMVDNVEGLLLRVLVEDVTTDEERSFRG